jgi:hypothetical protein
MSGNPKDGRFVLALRLEDGQRVSTERSFSTFRDAIEWCLKTKIWKLFDDLDWVLVDSKDRKTIGTINDVFGVIPFIRYGKITETDEEEWEEWGENEEDEIEDLKDVAEEYEHDTVKPRCWCGGYIILPSWQRRKGRALIGTCDRCTASDVLKYEDEGPRIF